MTDQPTGLPKPPQQADEDQRQYMARIIRLAEIRTAQAEHLMLMMREIRAWTIAIFFLAGINVGVWAAKLWWGL